PPSHALGRPGRAAPLDRWPLGRAGRRQPGPERPGRLGVVRRVPDRVRRRDGVRRVAGRADRHDTDPAAGRPRGGRGVGDGWAPGIRTMTRPIWALAAVMAGVSALTVGGCDALPGRPNVAKREVVPTEVTAFDVLYGQNCAGCHGADGRLGAARPLNDPVYLALVPADRLRTIIRAGVTGTAMPAFGIAAGGARTGGPAGARARGTVPRC